MMYKKTPSKFDIASDSLNQIISSKYMPRTIVVNDGFGYATVKTINNITGRVQQPRVSYNQLLSTVRTPNIKL